MDAEKISSAEAAAPNRLAALLINGSDACYLKRILCFGDSMQFLLQPVAFLPKFTTGRIRASLHKGRWLEQKWTNPVWIETWVWLKQVVLNSHLSAGQSYVLGLRSEVIVPKFHMRFFSFVSEIAIVPCSAFVPVPHLLGLSGGLLRSTCTVLHACVLTEQANVRLMSWALTSTVSSFDPSTETAKLKSRGRPTLPG